MKRFTITQWCQNRIKDMSDAPCRCIDATAGTGKDTLFLCSLLNAGGEVLAFDVQKTALDETKKRLESAGYLLMSKQNRGKGDCLEKEREEADFRDCLLCEQDGNRRVKLIHDGHEHMEQYAGAETADIIMFNLGYLPGGNHALATKPETTIEGLEKALMILKEGGFISLMIYSGGDSGFTEKNAVLSWLKTLDSRYYLVIAEAFYNRPNNPPLPVFIWKIKAKR